MKSFDLKFHENKFGEIRKKSIVWTEESMLDWNTDLTGLVNFLTLRDWDSNGN